MNPRSLSPRASLSNSQNDELYSGLVAAQRSTHPDDCNVQDLDSFSHVSDELSPDEEQAMYEQHMARLAEDARRAAACAEAFAPLAEAAERVRRQLAESALRGYREAACMGCGSVLWVEVGTGEPLCPACQYAEVEAV